jgi:VanZ family protein
MNKWKYRLAVGWTIFILIIVLLPASLFSSGNSNLNLPYLDKFVHLFLFAVFSWLWLNASTKTHYKSPHKNIFLKILILGTIFGISTELFQSINLIGRNNSCFDVIANILGILIGMLFYIIIPKFKKPK